MYKSICLIFAILLLNTAHSQDLGLVLFDGLPNSIINPAFDSDHNLLIGLGSRSYDFGNSAFTLDEGFEDGPNGKILRLDNVVEGIDKMNMLRFNEGLKTLEVAYKVKNVILYFGHEWNLNAALGYSNDLVRLAAFGNEPFIGKVANIGPELLYNSYHQTAIGFSSGIDQFRFGARFKLLNGVQNLQTTKSDLTLTTSNDIYQLDINSDYELFSSSLLEYNDIDDYDFNTKRLAFDHYLSKNWGYGVDVGISALLGNLKVFMSGIDIGSISWTEEANRYYKEGNDSYNGVDIQEFIGNEADYSIEDSIKSILSIDKEEVDYNSSINGSIYLGGRYSYNNIYTFGLIIRREILPIGDSYSGMVNVQRPIGKMFNIGLSATYKDKSIANIGGHVRFNYGPVQLYAIAHNAIGGILPEKFKSVSIRVGANLQLFPNETKG